MHRWTVGRTCRTARATAFVCRWGRPPFGCRRHRPTPDISIASPSATRATASGGIRWRRRMAAYSQFFLPSSTQTTCNMCRDLFEPIGQACAALPDGGAKGHWGGYAVTGEAACEVPATSSDPSHLAACATTSCLPAGKYVVKMCANRGGCSFSADASTTTCLSIPFDFPQLPRLSGRSLPSRCAQVARGSRGDDLFWVGAATAFSGFMATRAEIACASFLRSEIRFDVTSGPRRRNVPLRVRSSDDECPR